MALEKGTQTIEAFGAYGYVTQSVQLIRLIFPANIARNVNTARIDSIVGDIRIPAGGYIKNQGFDFTSYVKNRFMRSSQLVIELENTQGWGVTNNTPVVFTGTVGVTFT